MALQVWLPFNGNMNNQGLSPMTGSLATDSATYENGKIGQSLRISNYATDTATFSGIQNVSQWSVCLWLKLSSSDPTPNFQDFFLLTINNNGATSGGLRVEHRNTIGAFQICVPKNTDLTNANSWYTFYSNDSIAYDKWCHIAIVNDGVKYSVYLNGAFISSTNISVFSATSLSTLTGGLSLGMSGAYCWMNDFRVYDNALSANEVKKISQGLMLHYPLSREGFGDDNMLKSSPKRNMPNTYLAYQLYLSENLVGGQSYTMQIWDVDISHTGKTSEQLCASVYWGSGYNALFNFYIPSGHTDHMAISFTAPTSPTRPEDAKNLWLEVYNSPPSASGTLNMTIGCWKLEKGTTSTKWTPNRSDANYLKLGLHTNENLLKGNYSCTTTASSHTTSGSATVPNAATILKNNQGKTLWFSFDYSSKGSRNSETGRGSSGLTNRYGSHLSLNYTKTGAESATQLYPCDSYLVNDNEGRAIMSYTIPTDIDTVNGFTVALQPYASPASENTETWYLRNFKLEIGEQPTGYVPHKEDVAYSGTVVDVVHDGSGYGRNGVNNGVLYSFSSPRYDVCHDFYGSTNSYITIPAMNIDMDSVTFSVWAKWNAFNTWSRVFDFGEKTGGAGYSFLLANNGSNLCVGGRLVGGATLPDAAITAISSGVWNHIVVAVSGSTCNTYINGELIKTYSFNDSMGVATFNYNYLGKSNWSADKMFDGEISDFRIYATTLSASDVLELYNSH